MSRTRKGLRAPVKRAKRKKVNPRRRMVHSENGVCWFEPTPEENEELKQIFGMQGDAAMVGMSANLYRQYMSMDV